MFQPRNGTLKTLALLTHLNGRYSPNSTKISPSDWWLDTSTAAPFQGSLLRPSTRIFQKGWIWKYSWAQAQLYRWRMTRLRSKGYVRSKSGTAPTKNRAEVTAKK